MLGLHAPVVAILRIPTGLEAMDVAAAGTPVDGGGDFEGAVAAFQGDHVLHAALAVAAFANDDAAHMVLKGGRQNLAGAGPAAIDQDGDGNPGATLVLGANQCSMYVVQRAIAQWNGKVESSIRIAGVGNNATTQVVLGATGGFCASQFDTRNPPDSARFVLQRVDGRYGAPNLDTNGDGQIDCEEVRAYGSEPFGPRQPDNERCKSQP